MDETTLSKRELALIVAGILMAAIGFLGLGCAWVVISNVLA